MRPNAHVLLDHNVPRQLAAKLTDYKVTTASQIGWDLLTNGELIAAAEAVGFGALITADQNLRYQQNLAALPLAIIVLSTNRRRPIEASINSIIAAIAKAGPGLVIEVSCIED